MILPRNVTLLQVDIAPTLALLLGVPIPKNNIGVMITNVFQSLPGGFHFTLLYVMAKCP